MPVTLDELLKLAGLVADPNATRPRRVGDVQPPPTATGGTSDFGAAPSIPNSAQPPPRSLPPVVAPDSSMRTRYAGPGADASNAQLEAIQSFGSGEPFGSERERRTQPRDRVADDIAYAQDLERQPSNKKLDILTGITQGLASLEGNQPKQPWNYSGQERKLNDVYGRLGKELGVQGEQARIQAVKNQYDYRNQQVGMGQQRAMIAHYNASKEYTKGKNPQIDAMYAAAHLDFPDKSPKTAGKAGGAARKYHPPIYLPDGTAVMYNDSTGRFEDAQYGGEDSSSVINNPAMANVTATGAQTGQQYQVRPGTALTAESNASGQAATQNRFETSEARQGNQFQTQEFNRRQKEAGDAAEKWQKAYDESRELAAAVEQLGKKRDQQGGNLYGQDAANMATWPKAAENAQQRATSLMNEINTRHGDFYYIDQNGLTAKSPQPPTAQESSPTAPSGGARPKVDHAKFEKMYAEAKTPEERSRLMGLYQAALKAAGQQ